MNNKRGKFFVICHAYYVLCTFALELRNKVITPSDL